jgi:hypothetical protein
MSSQPRDLLRRYPSTSAALTSSREDRLRTYPTAPPGEREGAHPGQLRTLRTRGRRNTKPAGLGCLDYRHRCAVVLVAAGWQVISRHWVRRLPGQATQVHRIRIQSGRASPPSRRRVAPRGADRRAAVGGPRRWWRVHLGARRSTVWIDQLHSGSMKPQRREMLPLARALAARFLAASQMGLRECPGRVKSYPSYGLPVAGLYAINGPGTATYDSKECPWGSWRCCDPSRHRIGAGINRGAAAGR